MSAVPHDPGRNPQIDRADLEPPDTVLDLLRLAGPAGKDVTADPRALRTLSDALAGGPIEEALYAVIALVAARGDRLPLDDDVAGKLAGIRRRTWYRNQIIGGEFERLRSALLEAGIEHMLTGDLAAALGIYEEFGQRPVDELTVLVNANDADRAIAVVTAQGWRLDRKLPAVARAWLRGSRLLHDRAPCELHLYWNVLARFPCPEATRSCWQRSRLSRFRSCEVRLPSVTDQMLHLSDRLWHREPGARALWYADAMELARSGSFDWPQLLAEAQRFSVVLPVAALLNTLRRDLNVALPDPVTGWLEETRASLNERLEARYCVAGFPRKLLGELPVLYFAYRRQRSAVPREPAAGFATWLRDYWQRDSTAALATLLAKLSAQRLANLWRP